MPKQNPDPCPLCGGQTSFYPARDEWHSSFISCYPCDLVIYGIVGETRAPLVARWNRRIDKARED